ncbi:hypothetical protein LY76DRAFT_601166 [Colletotrichum caudatum]|nr:hypothetical protein LY76DRAFT_601166 [Colletotrichum caudatum]
MLVDTPSGCLVWTKDAQPKPRRQPSLGRFIKPKPHVDGIAMCIMLGQCLSDYCRAKRSSRSVELGNEGCRRIGRRGGYLTYFVLALVSKVSAETRVCCLGSVNGYAGCA